MKTAAKVVAWACTFGTLSAGCYSYTALNLSGHEKQRLPAGRIALVLTKDSTLFEFHKPPTIVNDTIFGEGRIIIKDGYIITEASIPLSEVTATSAKEFDFAKTSLAVGVPMLALGLMAWLFSKGVGYSW